MKLIIKSITITIIIILINIPQFFTCQYKYSRIPAPIPALQRPKMKMFPLAARLERERRPASHSLTFPNSSVQGIRVALLVLMSLFVGTNASWLIPGNTSSRLTALVKGAEAPWMGMVKKTLMQMKDKNMHTLLLRFAYNAGYYGPSGEAPCSQCPVGSDAAISSAAALNTIAVSSPWDASVIPNTGEPPLDCLARFL